MKAPLYSQAGKKTGDITLPEAVFGAAWNPDLVHQVVLAMQANARAGTAHTKDRSEVRGGGKKPWRQKGTGRARHGSRRSPIWAGGGVTFGPRNEKDFSQKLNKNARTRAFASALSKKFTDGEVLFVEQLAFAEPKAAEARAFLSTLAEAADAAPLAGKKQNAALIVLPERDSAAEKSFRNFGNVEVAVARDISTLDLLTAKYVVIAGGEAALETLKERTLIKRERVTAPQTEVTA
jgi:large subunit ribosomal protein L4